MPKRMAKAAAASSCEESGVDAQSATSAPPCLSVMTRFAVSTVTCRHAATFFPLSGCSFLNRLRMASRTGISRAAHSTSSEPFAASFLSLMSDFMAPLYTGSASLPFRHVFSVCIFVPFREFGNGEVMRLGTVRFDGMRGDRVGELHRCLYIEFREVPRDESRAVGVACSRRVDGVLYARSAYHEFLFLRDDEYLHVPQKLRFLPARLLLHDVYLVLVPEERLRALDARAHLLGRKLGQGLPGVAEERQFVFAVSVRQKDHVGDAARRDHAERAATGLHFAAVRFPAGAHVEGGYLVVGVVGDDECRRGRLVREDADG